MQVRSRPVGATTVRLCARLQCFEHVAPQERGEGDVPAESLAPSAPDLDGLGHDRPDEHLAQHHPGLGRHVIPQQARHVADESAHLRLDLGGEVARVIVAEIGEDAQTRHARRSRGASGVSISLVDAKQPTGERSSSLRNQRLSVRPGACYAVGARSPSPGTRRGECLS